MKKLLLITVAFLIGMTVHAQEFHFGAKLGGALTNFTISDAEDGTPDNDSKFGFYAGVVAEYMFNDQFAFAPELEIATAGAKNTVETSETQYGLTTTTSGSEDLKMLYLNVPIMFKYYPNENISLDFGPQLGFLMSAKYDYDYKVKVVDDTGSVLAENSDSEKDKDIKDNFNSTDCGLNIGATYKMESGLFINARYYLGLSNIGKDTGDATIKNNAIKFGIGYFFN